MKKKRKIISAVVLSLLAVGVMSVFESIVQPSYWIKSFIKVICFSSAVIIYSFIYKEKIGDLLNLKKKPPSRRLLIVTGLVYAGVIIAYLILKDQIDLPNIRENLLKKEGVTKDNFIFVFSYIIVINSFLEEAFFRGFIYNVFRKEAHPLSGMIYSSLLFAIYHLGIVALWFDPLILVVCIGGLAFAGAFLQLIEIKEDNLAASWFVHGCANLAINTIGTMMLFM